MTEDCNTVTLCGTVAETAAQDHELYGERFYTARLDVPRRSGAVDSLPLTIPERLGFLPLRGDLLWVHGQVRSYNRHVHGVNRLLLTTFVREAAMIGPEALPSNEVELTGTLCKPVVFRTTPLSREIGDMLLAVNRTYGKSDYLPCIAWGKNARLADMLAVGSALHIVGRIQSRVYEKTLEDGMIEERVAYEISCSTLEQIDQ